MLRHLITGSSSLGSAAPALGVAGVRQVARVLRQARCYGFGSHVSDNDPVSGQRTLPRHRQDR